MQSTHTAPADTGTQAARAGWTKPFHGLSHFKTADPKRWATVADRGHRAAMAAGEHWATTGALRGVAS